MKHLLNLRSFILLLGFYITQSTGSWHKQYEILDTFENEVKSYAVATHLNHRVKRQDCPAEECPENCPVSKYFDEKGCKRCECDWNLPCPAGYRELESQCIKISMRKDKRGWKDAKEACAADGGHLFTVTETNLLKGLVTGMNTTDNFWLGADKLEDEEVCPSGYTEVGGQCFQFSKGRSNWDEANSLCGGESGQLASLQDHLPLRDYVKRYFRKRDFWIGGRFQDSWQWVSGDPFDPSFPWGVNMNVKKYNFKPDEQRCMTFKYFPVEDENEYVDKKCNRKKHFICEKKKVKLDGWRWTSGEKVPDSFPWGINDKDEQQYKGDNQHCMTFRYFPEQKIHQYVDNRCFKRYRYICEADRCPKGYKLVGAQCLKPSAEKLPWREAKEDCERGGAAGHFGWNNHLVVVKDTQTVLTFTASLNTNENYWVGANNLVDEEICPFGYTSIGSQCLQIGNDKVSWDEAKYLCEQRSAQLASLKEPMILRDFILNYFAKASFWIGGRYHRDPDGWKWVSGSPFNSSFPWGINDRNEQQDKGIKQDCMLLRYFPIQDEQEYVDNRCQRKNGYICEKPKVKIDGWKWVSGERLDPSFKWGEKDYKAERHHCMTLRLFEEAQQYQYVDNICERKKNFICEATRMDIEWTDNDEDDSNGDIENSCTDDDDEDYLPSCLDGYELTGEQCLLISKRKDTLTWMEAKAECVARNGQLVVVKDSNVLKSAVISLKSSQNFWLGADDLQEQEQCPTGYVEVGSQCFLMSDMKLNWDQAKDKCESMSAQLASLAQDPMELRDHVSRYYSTKSFWLGGRFYRHPEWEWLSGAPFNSSFPWGTNDRGIQQDRGEKQECLTLRYFPIQDEHEYVDNICKRKHHYICEKPKIKLDGWRWVTGEKVIDSFQWGINDKGDQQDKGEKQHCMTLRYFPKQDTYHYVDNRCQKRYRYICEAPRCPNGFELVGQQCIAISVEKLPWMESKAKCDDLEQFGWQTQLLIVKDTEGTKTHIANLNTQESFWLGAFKFREEICPGGYVEIGTECFLMARKKVSWDEAKTACEENSSQLASLKDPKSLRDHVIKYYPKSSFWVGGRYHRLPDGWKWLSGAALNRSFPWGINDRNVQQWKGEKQDCMILRYFPIQDEQEYVDNRCRKKNNFICEKPKVKTEHYMWVSGAAVNSSFPWGINDKGTQQVAGEKQDCMTLRYFPEQKTYQYVDNRCEKKYRYVCEAIRSSHDCTDNFESDPSDTRTGKSLSRPISSTFQWYISGR